MNTKILEIRDSGTFLVVLATMMKGSGHLGERRRDTLLRASGWDSGYVIVTKLGSDPKTCTYPHEWGSNTRTMPEAHKYIQAHWDEIGDGDLICVETIIGLLDEPKHTERPGSGADYYNRHPGAKAGA